MRGRQIFREVKGAHWTARKRVFVTDRSRCTAALARHQSAHGLHALCAREAISAALRNASSPLSPAIAPPTATHAPFGGTRNLMKCRSPRFLRHARRFKRQGRRCVRHRRRFSRQSRSSKGRGWRSKGQGPRCAMRVRVPQRTASGTHAQRAPVSSCQRQRARSASSSAVAAVCCWSSHWRCSSNTSLSDPSPSS